MASPVLPGLCADTTGIVISYLREYVPLLRFLSRAWSRLKPINTKHFCSRVTISGYLNVVKWCLSHGCPLERDIFKDAARAGHVDILRWGFNVGLLVRAPKCSTREVEGTAPAVVRRQRFCLLDEEIFASAAGSGRLGLLRWLKSVRCPWNSNATYKAARHGRLDALKWLKEQRCPMTTMICAAAASKGQLDVLRWARSVGHDWEGDVSVYAASGGHMDFLKWAYEKGCPITRDTRDYAVRAGHTDIVEWLKTINCREGMFKAVTQYQRRDECFESQRFSLFKGLPRRDARTGQRFD